VSPYLPDVDNPTSFNLDTSIDKNTTIHERPREAKKQLYLEAGATVIDITAAPVETDRSSLEQNVKSYTGSVEATQ